MTVCAAVFLMRFIDPARVAATVPHRDPATPGAVPPAGWTQGPPAHGPAGYAEPRPYGAVPPAGWPEGPTANGATTCGVPGNGAALNPVALSTLWK